MNNTCMGEFFKVFGRLYYDCRLDNELGAVYKVANKLTPITICEHCNRPIEADRPTRKVRLERVLSGNRLVVSLINKDTGADCASVCKIVHNKKRTCSQLLD